MLLSQGSSTSSILETASTSSGINLRSSSKRKSGDENELKSALSRQPLQSLPIEDFVSISRTNSCISSEDECSQSPTRQKKTMIKSSSLGNIEPIINEEHVRQVDNADSFSPMPILKRCNTSPTADIQRSRSSQPSITANVNIRSKNVVPSLRRQILASPKKTRIDMSESPVDYSSRSVSSSPSSSSPKKYVNSNNSLSEGNLSPKYNTKKNEWFDIYEDQGDTEIDEQAMQFDFEMLEDDNKENTHS